MSTSYYNTTQASGRELREFNAAAANQEHVIAAFFRKNAIFSYAPSEIQRSCLPGAPLTSVRRAITNLTNQGVLVKTSKRIKGPYGRPEFKWQLAQPKSVSQGRLSW